MINHLSLGVSDIKRSVAFYDAVFEPLGYSRLWTEKSAAGYGVAGGDDEPFALKQEADPSQLGASPRSHLAFTAETRAMVVSFYEAALKNGGVDLGAPGLRPHYGEHYFAAFVGDPDGYRIEAVCHALELT